MTVERTTVYSGPYIANGVTTAFPFDFQAASTAEVAVEIDGGAIAASDYVVSLNGDGTGSVTFFTAPASGQVFIYSDPLFTQEVQFENQGPFYQSSVNEPIDRSAIRDLWLRARMMLLTSSKLLFPSSRAGKFLAWDASGDPYAASGTGSDSALRTDLAASSGALLVGGSVIVRSSIGQIAAMGPGGSSPYLSLGGRSGQFLWLTGNRTAEVASDPLQGIYIARASDPTGASGCWGRIWDGVHGRPEWFGAAAGNPAIDNSPAISACITICPITQLGAGKYYIGNSGMGAGSVCIPITINGRVLRGVSQTQDDLAPSNGNFTATQLVITNGYASGIRIGQAANPGGSVPSWVENVVVEDLSIMRSVTINNPTSGFANAPTGLIMQWANLCEVRNVWAKEHTIGFYTTGAVACRYYKCRALRYLDAVNAGNDFFSGFFQDNTAASGFNSGNASLYYDHCGAFSNESAGNTYTYCAGLQTYQGFTDTFITKFETVNCGYGIDAAGRSSTALDWHTENLSIRDPILDGCRFAGIRITTTGPRTAVRITGGYVGSTVATGPSSIGVHIYESHGAVTIEGFQAIVVTGNPATGLLIENSSGVSCFGNQWIDFQDPIRLVNAVWCHLEDRAMQASQSVATAGLQMSGSSRNKIACDIAASNSTIHLPAGVALIGSGNDYNEINCTGIYTPSITGGASNKVTGTGTGNVLTGVTA